MSKKTVCNLFFIVAIVIMILPVSETVKGILIITDMAAFFIYALVYSYIVWKRLKECKEEENDT